MPEVKEFEKLSLLTIADGSAPEIFGEELQKVLDNIADPNTTAKQKRQLILKVTIEPDADREALLTTVECAAKLAPVKAHAGMAYMARTRSGKVSAVAHNIRQPDLPFVDDEEAQNVRQMDRAKQAAAGE
jgi:hypothetical protein